MANHSQQQIETSHNSTRTCSSECIAWLTVFGIQAVAIVTLNALTIIVYLKERSLRKRSMYLVINQAFADVFTGASIFICFPLWAYDFELWTIDPPLSDELILPIRVLESVSPIASLLNLGAISLERTHATFHPFKHRLVKKKIFVTVAAIVWIAAGAISAGNVSKFALKSPFSKRIRIFSILVFSSCLFCLLTVIVSYSSRAINVVYSYKSCLSLTTVVQPVKEEIFIVTVVSLLLTLPFIIVHLCFFLQLYTSILVNLQLSWYFMFYANSLVNRHLYTVRLPEFKKTLLSILHCRSQPQPAPAFPLNEM